MAEYLKAGFATLNGLEDGDFENFFQGVLKNYISKSDNVCVPNIPETLESNDRYILEKTVIYILEQLLGALDEKTAVSAFIEKLKAVQPEKKQIMIGSIENNLNSLKKAYLEGIIAGSGYYLDDFNWNINVCLNSSTATKLKQPILQLELTLRKYITREEKRVIVELNAEELEGFVQNLYSLETKLE